MAHDVFVSYSSKDKTIADAVCAKMEESKIRAWIAPRDVPPGSNFAKCIMEAINACNVFVLIWSANANTSEHILNEINQAFDHGITIIPFRIQDIQPTDEMRYYFGRTHWLDAIDPPLEKHIATLRDTILVNLGRELQLEKAPEISDQEKEPAGEKAKDVQPSTLSPRKKKAPKKDKEIQSSGAAPTNLARFIPYTVGGLALLTLVVLFVSGVFKGSPPTETMQSSPSQNASITPTRTVRPTETSSAIPSWVKDFSEPILSAIKDQPPDFADDFSEFDPNWNYSLRSVVHTEEDCSNSDGAMASISNGSMKSSVDPNCPQGLLDIPDGWQLANYVMQTDINLEQTKGTIAIENFYSSEVALSFSLDVNGNWGFMITDGEVVLERVGGKISFDSSKPVTITIINKSPTFLIYLDSSLLFFKDDLELLHRPDGMRFNMWNDSDQFSEIETFELDNVKIWDLDKLELSESSYTSDGIEEANAIAEPILTAINDQQPDFADDFSQVDPAWDDPPGEGLECVNPGNSILNISDGSMKYSIINCQVGILIYPDMQYTNFVLQLDVNFHNQPLGLEFRMYNQSPEEEVALIFFLQRTGDNWGFQVVKGSENIEETYGNTNIDFTKPITFTIVNISPTFFVYLDSSLLMSYTTQKQYDGPFLLDFTISSWDVTPTETLTLELDNVKIWDLDKIED